jgi:hypothetical protein
MQAPGSESLILRLVKLACQVAQQQDAPDVDCYTLSSTFIDTLLERFPDVYNAWDQSVDIE